MPRDRSANSGGLWDSSVASWIDTVLLRCYTCSRLCALTRLPPDKALYDQAQLSRLVAPLPARDLAILNSLLDNPALPDYLLGLDSKTWNDPTLASDLCSVAPVHAYTPLTTLLIRLFLGPYNRPIGRRRRARNGEAGAINADADLWYYRDSRLEFPAHVASTVLASVLPMAAIAVLYVVPGMTQRLGIVAAFMAMFSLTLTLLTQAKGVEIAAATAAYVLCPPPHTLSQRLSLLSACKICFP